jgi:hypothetical protein
MGGMGGMGLYYCVHDTGLLSSSLNKLMNSISFYGIVRAVGMSLHMYHDAPFVLRDRHFLHAPRKRSS